MGDFDEAVEIISSLSKKVIAEEGHHGNPTEVFEYKVIGRSPSGEANLLQTPEGHIIERIATGKQRGWWKVIIGKTEYIGMTPESTIGIAKRRGAIPEAVPAVEIPKAVPEEELPPDHEMLLHFGIEEVGSPGIVLDEARARATPCSCFTYKSKDLCWSRSIIGMLSQPQQQVYCVAGKTYKEQPKLVERYTTFAAAAERAHKEIESMPKGTARLEAWLSAMGRELSREGIEV